MYIYLITNKINNKKYVGQTTQSVKKRFIQHKSSKSSNSILHKSIRKYGKENFVISVLMECYSIDELNYFEQYFIEYYNTLSKNGYNLKSGGLNCKHSIVTKNKLRNKFLNKKRPNTSIYYGVSKYKRNNGFKAFITFPNKKVIYIIENKSEKYCAYMYDQYVIKNNIKDRKLNNLNLDEVLLDYNKFNNKKINIL